MQEGFDGIKIIKLLGRENFFFNKFKVYNKLDTYKCKYCKKPIQVSENYNKDTIELKLSCGNEKQCKKYHSRMYGF